MPGSVLDAEDGNELSKVLASRSLISKEAGPSWHISYGEVCESLSTGHGNTPRTRVLGKTFLKNSSAPMVRAYRKLGVS